MSEKRNPFMEKFLSRVNKLARVASPQATRPFGDHNVRARCEKCGKIWVYDRREQLGRDRPLCPECDAAQPAAGTTPRSVPYHPVLIKSLKESFIDAAHYLMAAAEDSRGMFIEALSDINEAFPLPVAENGQTNAVCEAGNNEASKDAPSHESPEKFPKASAGTTPQAERPTAYMCPKGCGCIWRDNIDGTMSFFGQNSKSCKDCEVMPLEQLIPVWAEQRQTMDYMNLGWAAMKRRAEAAEADLAALREAAEEILKYAPSPQDFEIGGRYDYGEDCGNAGDVSTLGAAQMHYQLANIVRKALSAAPERPTTSTADVG